MGKLRRPAYIIKINPSKYDIKKYERRGVIVLGFNGKSATYSDLYQELFRELKTYWEENVVKLSYFINEDTLSEFTLPKDSPSRLCYFAIPYQLSSYYREYIFPIVSQFGFQPILNTDVIESGENLIAKISSLIDRSVVIISDLTYSTDSVLSELNTAKLKNKPIIILTEEEIVPSDIDDIEVLIKRSSAYEEPGEEFIEQLQTQLEKFQLPRSKSYREPLRLLEKKEYKAAVISAFILLEYELCNYIKEKERLKSCTISQAITKALEIGLMSETEHKKLLQVRNARNILLHTRRTPNKKKATEYVELIMEVLEKLRFYVD